MYFMRFVVGAFAHKAHFPHSIFSHLIWNGFWTQIFMTHSTSMSILFRLRRRIELTYSSWLTVKDQLIIKCEIKRIALAFRMCIQTKSTHKHTHTHIWEYVCCIFGRALNEWTISYESCHALRLSSNTQTPIDIIMVRMKKKL